MLSQDFFYALCIIHYSIQIQFKKLHYIHYITAGKTFKMAHLGQKPLNRVFAWKKL